MNTIKIFFFLLFLLPYVNLNAQDIPKKANTIIVHGITFNESAKQLLDKGFIIDKTDSTLQYIYTKQKKTKGFWLCYVTVYIRIKDSNAIITGMCSDNTETRLGATTMKMELPAAYKGENIGLPKLGFKEMNDFALSFNKPVEYLVQ